MSKGRSATTSNKSTKANANEKTLREIAQTDGKTDKMMTFGVIIDSSEPTRDEKKGGYITKLLIALTKTTLLSAF